MTLIVLSRYRSAQASYEPGQVLTLTDAEGRRLLADAPGCFQVMEVAPALPDAPPADKAVKAAPRRKGGV